MKYRPMHPLKRLRKILADVQQQRRDVAYWNEHRTDAEPFDLGRYIVFERIVIDTISAWGTADFPAKHEALQRAVEAFALDE